MKKIDIQNEQLKYDNNFYDDFSKLLKILNEKTEDEYKNLIKNNKISLEKNYIFTFIIIFILTWLYIYYHIMIYIIIAVILWMWIILKKSETIKYKEWFYNWYKRAKWLYDEDSDFEAYTKLNKNLSNNNPKWKILTK